MVRKFSPVMALQDSTYDRAQEGLTTTGHFPNDGTGTKMQKALKIGTLNCKGANHISAREKIVHMMKTNTEELHDQYCFIFSTCITDQQREEASKARDMVKAAVGKGKQKGRNNLQLYNLDAKKLGVAVVYHKTFQVLR